MSTGELTVRLWLLLVVVIGLGLLLPLPLSSSSLAQRDVGYIAEVRSIYADDLGLLNPAGLAFSPEANVFLVVESRTATLANLVEITPYGDLVRVIHAGIPTIDLANLAFDSRFDRLLAPDSSSNELIAIRAQPDGHLAPSTTTLTRFEAGQFGLQDPRGMAVDPATGVLFILDRSGPQIVRVEPGTHGDLDSTAALDGGRISRIRVKDPGLAGARGLAFNQGNGHLYLIAPASQRVYEITTSGQVVAWLDLSPFGFVDPRALVFAPSGDPTDDPLTHHLYVADPGPGAGRIVELSLSPPARPIASVPVSQVTLERTTWMSQYTPPSPDPAGVAYLPNSNTLLVSDSEVDEIPQYFTGKNLFEVTRVGGLVDTLSTLSFSPEPTGLVFDPFSQHLFLSDDNLRFVFELDPGPDELYDTADDIIARFSTAAFGSVDPEGLAVDSRRGHLFVVDGLGEEVYDIAPGVNRVFDGVPPSGDDQVSHFDTTALGLADPKGIEFDPGNGHLYIASGSNKIIAETTAEGTLLRYLDLASVNSYTVTGLTCAPSGTVPTRMNLYLVDRGVDNDFDPTENDGRLYEISFNRPPVVDTASSQFIVLPDGAALDGSVTDDGLPDPPAAVTTLWTQLSGPGTATIADPQAVATTASFSQAGTYILRLTADDGDLSASDEIRVVVIEEGGRVTRVWLPVVASTVGGEGKLSKHGGLNEQRP